MPFMSPNIVIVPTGSLIDKRKNHTKSISSGRAATLSANMVQPSSNMPLKVTNTSQKASKPSSMSQSDINVPNYMKTAIQGRNTLKPKVAQSDQGAISKTKVTQSHGTISKTKVAQSDQGAISKTKVAQSDQGAISNTAVAHSDTNSARTADSTTVKQLYGRASNDLQSVGHCTNAKPIKVILLSTSNDVIKQKINSPDKYNCHPDIKMNLLPRPMVTKTADTTAGLPRLQTTNLSTGVNPTVDTTWTFSSQLETPTKSIDCRSCTGTTSNCYTQFQNPTNSTTDVPHCMSMNWTNPNLSETIPNPAVHSRTYMDPTWAYPPQLQTSTNNPAPLMDITWTYPHKFQTPINPNNNSSPCIDPAWTRPPLSPTPPNFNTGFGPRMGMNWTHPTLSETIPNPAIHSRTYMDPTWANPPQLQTSINNSVPLINISWTNPHQFQTPVNLNINSSPCIDPSWTRAPPLPTPRNFKTGFGPRMDTQTRFTKKTSTNNNHVTNENINSTNRTTSLFREHETTNIKITPQDTQSSSVKSPMDYTWLTRAHYANINQPDKNTSNVKQVIQSKNAEKCVGVTPKIDLGKEKIKPLSVSGKDNKLRYSNSKNTKSKECSKEKLINSKENAKIALKTCIKKSVSSKKCTNKKNSEKERRSLIKAIKTLETNIKNLTSEKIPFKIPKLSDSNKEKEESNELGKGKPRKKAETSSEKQQIKNTFTMNKMNKIVPDKSEEEVKQTPTKRKSSQDQIYRNHGRHNSEYEEKIRKISRSKRSEPEQRQIRREPETEIRHHPKSEKTMHNKERKGKQNLSFDSIDEYKNRSGKVVTHCSEKLRKKRKRRDSSCESVTRKHFCNELQNVENNENVNPRISEVTFKNSKIKHPRVQAPSSDDANDDFDLRSKLNRMNENHYVSVKNTHEGPGNDQTETPFENLVISINRNDDDEIIVSPKPESSIPKQKPKKYKKIRLVIKVIQEDTSNDSSSDDSTVVIDSTDVINENIAEQKLDLSFLDDFNIDEIVNSLEQSPKRDSVKQNYEKVENTTTSPKFVTKQFVQPIIIKKKIKTEHEEPEIQSDDKYSRGNAPDVMNSEYMKNNIREYISKTVPDQLNDITNEVFIQNIKQEKPEDQIEKVNIIVNSNTDMPYHQTNVGNIFQPVNHINTVVENTQVCIDTLNAELIRDIKSETSENYNSDAFNQDILMGDEKYNTKNADTQVLTYMSNKEFKKLEYTNSSNDETNHEIDENVPVKDNKEVIVSSKTNKTINVEEADISETIQLVVEDESPEDILTNNHGLAKYDVIEDAKSGIIIEDTYKVKITTDIVEPININDVNRTETIQPIEEKSVKDKSTNITHTSLDTSDVTIDYGIKISSEIVMTTKSIQNVSAIEKTQLEVEEKALEDELGTNTLTISDTPMENNYEVTTNSNLIKTSTVENETKPHKVEETASKDKSASNDLVKFDITTEGKNKSVNNKLPNNSAVVRTDTIMHPSLKSNKDLAIKIENKIFIYLKLKMTVTSMTHNGKFGKIFICERTNGQKHALKIVNNNCEPYRLGFLKNKMLNALQYDIPKENLNTVYFINGFTLDRKWCFLMEYYPINLKQAMERNTLFNMDAVQELAKQLVSAVLVMRTKNIVHSDIKPHHILLNSTKTNLKVCGFDAAYYADENIEVLPNIGTMQYRAPEIILGYSAGFSIDVWATALVIYEMAANEKLFSSSINYNNNVLFNQLNLCGDLPYSMVQNSRFSSSHFVGTEFKRILGRHGQHILYNIHNFNVKNKMCNILITAYQEKWSRASIKPQAKHMAKLALLCRLLDRMLVLDPKLRLPIEYVYADTFFSKKIM